MRFVDISDEELAGECLHPTFRHSPQIARVLLGRVLALFLGIWYQDNDVVFHIRSQFC